MLNQDAATPLYVQLMNLLEKDIQSGVYQPGDKLATETVMAKTYGVSLITVRKAIGALIEKDMVIRKPAKVCQEEKSENSDQNNCCRVQLSIRQL